MRRHANDARRVHTSFRRVLAPALNGEATAAGGRPSPDNSGDIRALHTFSTDSGRTWSTPVLLAGSGAPFSDAGASSFEEALVLDQTMHHLLAVYYEKPTKDSDLVELRYRVLQADGTWSPPVTIDRTPYATPGGEMRFGDYFGAQAQDGVLHVVHHPLDPTDGYEYIAYVAVRY